MAFRYDTGGALANAERTPQGGYRIPALPSRSGVFPYLQADGSTRLEWRPPEEVFAPASLTSLRHAPVTDLHPEKDGKRIAVTPENFKDLAVGHVGEDVRQEGDHVGASILVQDSGMIGMIDRKEREECSCGYHCDLDPTPGVTPGGERFDAIQKNIRYNHLALGPGGGWGRGGSTVRLRLDAGDGIQQLGDQIVNKVIFDGKEYISGSTEHVAALQAFGDQQKGRADAAENQAKTAAAQVPDPKVQAATISKRVKLITDCARAARIKGVRFDEDLAAGADESSLIVQLIALLDPTFKAEGKSPEYLMGYASALIGGLKEPAAGETDASKSPTEMSPGQGQGAAPPIQGVDTPKTDSKQTIFSARAGTQERSDQRSNSNAPPAMNPDKARHDMIDRNKNRWKQPLSASKDTPKTN